MSTNYYLVRKCDCCGVEEKIHIGKIAYGWKFMFRGYRDHSELHHLPEGSIGLRTFGQWAAFITGMACTPPSYVEDSNGFEVQNEYGDMIACTEFLKLVMTTKDLKCHAEWIMNNHSDMILDGNLYVEGDHGFSVDFNDFS